MHSRRAHPADLSSVYHGIARIGTACGSKSASNPWSLAQGMLLIAGPKSFFRGKFSKVVESVNYAALLQSALVALLRNKMRSILTVLGITIGIAAVICVVAIGKAGQARVEQQLNNLGDNF